MFIIQGHRFAHNGRVMNIILGADYANYTDSFVAICCNKADLRNPCNPRLIFYSLITFLYSATAIFSARYALIRFVCACVHDNCADKTSAILDFPSL